ncbi:unnamed protein product, partial [Polarella glacialis]
ARAALGAAAKRKPLSLPDSLLTEGLPQEVLLDLRQIAENDYWEGKQVSGKMWITEWLRDGQKWATEALQSIQSKTAEGAWCKACWKSFSDDAALQEHQRSKDHMKKMKMWVWRYGFFSTETGVFSSTSLESGKRADQLVAPNAGFQQAKLPAVDAASARSRGSGKSKPSEILAQAAEAAGSEEGVAKKELLCFRDSLTLAQRLEVIKKIGLPRANDAPTLASLQHAFSEQVYRWMCQVKDQAWLWKEPSFSWLAGFYWHPESTSLPQLGPVHADRHCHLCEIDCYDETHPTSRRHAESLQRWVHKHGALPLKTTCDRCPGGPCASTARPDDGPPLDLNVSRRSLEEHDGQPQFPDEAEIPGGFTDLHRRSLGQRPTAVPYAAFVVRFTRDSQGSSSSRSGRKQWPKPPAAPEMIQVSSGLLRIGARVGKKEKDKRRQRWAVSLQKPLPAEGDHGLWRSLAIPLQKVAEGFQLEFALLMPGQSAGGPGAKEDAEPVELGRLCVTAPAAGMVVVVELELTLPMSDGSAAAGFKAQSYLQPVRTPEVVGLASFVGSGQVQAFGGLRALRGSQRAFQLLTEEIMLSFLLHLPSATSEEPHPGQRGAHAAGAGGALDPVLVFLHGDMERGSSSWAMPGLAAFCDEFGPAELCSSHKRADHPVRRFVVVTPCCPEEFWWFRHKALHDSTSYVPAMEDWFRYLFRWLSEDLAVSPPTSTSEGRIRLVGQSMGAYASLELARAMPEMVAAVVALAPCYDACRLDWLADRLRHVPLWVIIARQDAMCSFEEAASLVLKLRDSKALCARLTSIGFKDHNDTCKPLAKAWLYHWLLDPLGDIAQNLTPGS